MTARDYYEHKEDHNTFVITQVSDKVNWLHINSSYIGSFSTLKKAQKVAELILEG